MLSKLYAIFLLCAACAQYVELITTYCYWSTEPIGNCMELGYDLTTPGIIKFVRRWVNVTNGEHQSDIFYLKYLNGNPIKLYDVVDKEGKRNGTSVAIQVDDHGAKFNVINSDGSINRHSCVSAIKNPDQRMKKALKELCNEKDLKEVNFNDCHYTRNWAAEISFGIQIPSMIIHHSSKLMEFY